MKKIISFSAIAFLFIICPTCYLSVVKADPPVTANQDISDESIEQMPTARDPWAVNSLAPGVQREGGVNTGDSGNNALDIDGVHITDPNKGVTINTIPGNTNSPASGNIITDGSTLQSYAFSSLEQFAKTGDLNDIECEGLTEEMVAKNLKQLINALAKFDKSQSKDPELQKKADCIKKKVSEHYKKLEKSENQKNSVQREKKGIGEGLKMMTKPRIIIGGIRKEGSLDMSPTTDSVPPGLEGKYIYVDKTADTEETIGDSQIPYDTSKVENPDVISKKLTEHGFLTEAHDGNNFGEIPLADTKKELGLSIPEEGTADYRNLSKPLRYDNVNGISIPSDNTIRGLNTSSDKPFLDETGTAEKKEDSIGGPIIKEKLWFFNKIDEKPRAAEKTSDDFKSRDFGASSEDFYAIRRNGGNDSLPCLDIGIGLNYNDGPNMQIGSYGRYNNEWVFPEMSVTFHPGRHHGDSFKGRFPVINIYGGGGSGKDRRGRYGTGTLSDISGNNKALTNLDRVQNPSLTIDYSRVGGTVEFEGSIKKWLNWSTGLAIERNKYDYQLRETVSGAPLFSHLLKLYINSTFFGIPIGIGASHTFVGTSLPFNGMTLTGGITIVPGWNNASGVFYQHGNAMPAARVTDTKSELVVRERANVGVNIPIFNNASLNVQGSVEHNPAQADIDYPGPGEQIEVDPGSGFNAVISAYFTFLVGKK